MIRFPWQGRDEAKQREAIRGLFSLVFSRPEGRQVLTIILEDLKYFDPARSPEDKALNEYAKFLLAERMGITDSYAVTEALLGAATTDGAPVQVARRSMQ